MNPVHDYHERSKHQLHRYAPGPGGLDWATQPDPFRRFAGAARIDLPLLAGELPPAWDDLFAPGRVKAQDLNLETLGHLLQLSFGLSAWKSYGGSRWALRCNPSSGNLHPTEAYLICPQLPGLPAGVYHYQSAEHYLEQRAAAPLAWEVGVLVALTGIHWREAWKYGMRAFRYCQHDCGHALAALSYAAAVLGWPARLLEHWGDGQIAAMTGAGRETDFAHGEQEAPEAVVWLGPGEPPSATAILAMLEGAAWKGQANVLSHDHREWPDIPEIAAATAKPPGAISPALEITPLPALPPASAEPATTLIRRRRSAQAFDGVTCIGAPVFFRMLDALMPRRGVPPWSLLNSRPSVHPVLFVHRVEGIEPGVYCLLRDPEAFAGLKSEMHAQWLWQDVPGCPQHLPFYLLAPLDTRQFAETASCHQSIAADSAFSLAMLARFDDITPEQPWLYRQRFWEAGILGQVLYLEAEAAGVQGTGIGCYFDDVVHQALGLKPTCAAPEEMALGHAPEEIPQGEADALASGHQDVYHFTVGKAVTDQRIQSEPAYARRKTIP